MAGENREGGGWGVGGRLELGYAFGDFKDVGQCFIMVLNVLEWFLGCSQ